MTEREKQAYDFRSPMVQAIRAAVIIDTATPYDRLAAAVLLLAMELFEARSAKKDEEAMRS